VPSVELGVVIGKTGRDISEVNAMEHVAGYGEQQARGRTPVDAPRRDDWLLTRSDHTVCQRSPST